MRIYNLMEYWAAINNAVKEYSIAWKDDDKILVKK